LNIISFEWLIIIKSSDFQLSKKIIKILKI
jgi:hypothetical protein